MKRRNFNQGRAGVLERFRQGLLLLVCALLVLGARADVPDENFEWEQETVRELLRRDIQQALRSTARPTSMDRGPGSAARPIESATRPRLVALYGVGRQLMAEVRIGTQTLVYVRGHPFPIGHGADATVYRLREMKGRCVQLERAHEQESLCLPTLLGEVRP